MQDATNEPAEPQGIEPTGHDEPTGTRKDAPTVAEMPSPLPPSGSRAQQHALLPQRELSYAVIAGVIAGVVTALLTMVATLVFSGTFHAASQQIAVDKLTVKTALALAGLELLNFALSLLVGFFVDLIVGRIAVRRRLGFLLWCIDGGLVSLFGTCVATVRHAYYVRYAEESPR